MELLTSAYWQQGRNDSALLLQHYQYRGIPLCLVCLCAGEGEGCGRAGAYLTERLLTWFRNFSWRRLARDPENLLSKIGGQLAEKIEKTAEELADCGLLAEREMLDFAGLLCAGEHFLLVRQGSHRIYLLNRSFNRGNIQTMAAAPEESQTGIFLRQGVFESEIGLLLASESFCRQLTERELRECLQVTEIRTQAQADRHLGELGIRAEELGGKNMGAALLLAKSKETKGN